MSSSNIFLKFKLTSSGFIGLCCFSYSLVSVAQTGNNLFHEQYEKIVTRKNDETIVMRYPVLNTQIKTAKQFNQAVHSIVLDAITDFKEQRLKDIPVNSHGNTLWIGYETMYQSHNLLSFRFEIEGSYPIAAHGYTDFDTINYDIKTGKILTLHNMFKPNFNYLKFIAAQSRQQLAKKSDWINDKETLNWFKAGTAPTIKNYQNWNLTPKGLLITFLPYQVASYAKGPQTVLISRRRIGN